MVLISIDWQGGLGNWNKVIFFAEFGFAPILGSQPMNFCFLLKHHAGEGGGRGDRDGKYM